ncbi:MAG: hypothetical protein ACM3PP_03100 [Candidatus Saccharibacteria bacterium]
MTDLNKLKDLIESQHYLIKSVKATSKGTTLITLRPGGCSCYSHDEQKPLMMITTEPECIGFAEDLKQTVQMAEDQGAKLTSKKADLFPCRIN